MSYGIGEGQGIGYMAERNFALELISSTTVTPELLAVAEMRAKRSQDARQAKFLDQYRIKR